MHRLKPRRSGARTVVALIVIAASVLMGSVAVGVGSATPAYASSVGGGISRGEVINRAQDWFYKQPTYDTSGTETDVDGRRYRTDCSGFVSMARHMDDSYATFELIDHPDVTELSSRSCLKPGDALLDPTGVLAERHIVLFAGWADSDHTRFNLYELNGVLDMEYRTRNLSDYGSQYRPIRYDKIVDQSNSSYAPPAPVNTCRLGDDYAQNRLDVIFDSYRNVKFVVDTCIRKLDKLSLEGWITVTWQPAADADPLRLYRFDGLTINVRLENNDDPVSYVKVCDFRDEVHGSYSGSRTCKYKNSSGDTTIVVSSGVPDPSDWNRWTIDGTIVWNGIGSGNNGTLYLIDSVKI